ncbi:MAG: hypothetical protein SGPRY_007809, partial [Prymnesium sp.]
MAGARLEGSVQLSVIGQLLGASQLRASRVHCSWKLSSGGAWTAVNGTTSGDTQCDEPADSTAFVFQHPVDVVFQGEELRGWPRFEIEIRLIDAHGRSDLLGYSIAHVPTTPGQHTLSCPVWRPHGSLSGRTASPWYMGGRSRLPLWD